MSTSVLKGPRVHDFLGKVSVESYVCKLSKVCLQPRTTRERSNVR